jgi:hypothetical protein
MSYEHFARQEEEISNTYMSANGEILQEIIVSDSVKKSNLQKQAGSHWSQNPLLSWMKCGGLDVGCGLKRLAIFGAIAYVGYRVLINKK